MGAPLVSEKHFVAAWQKYRSPEKVAQAIGISVRRVYDRRARLAAKGYDLQTIPAGGRPGEWSHAAEKFERKREYEIKNGVVIIFSDPHFYPDQNDVAIQAIETLARELKPKAVICGGDALDGTQISRFDPTRGWHEPPSLKEQLDSMVEGMDRIKRAAGKGAITAMTLGNHDCRFSRYLKVNAPAVEDLPGTRLEDFIPAWPLSWTVRLKGKVETVIRHRNQTGMLHLQAQKAGCHIVHGHLHKLNVHAVAQYERHLFSVDCGSFSDPQSDAFDYTEDGPPHCQGFVVLTYRDSELCWPEVVNIRGGKAYFRGAVL